MSYHQLVPMEERFERIMHVLRGKQDHVTSSQICREYIGNGYTTSDVGSTGQILNVLALAGVVSKITIPRTKGSGKSFYAAYKLKESK